MCRVASCSTSDARTCGGGSGEQLQSIDHIDRYGAQPVGSSSSKNGPGLHDYDFCLTISCNKSAIGRTEGSRFDSGGL